MIKTILLGGQRAELQALRQTITDSCPQLICCGLATTAKKAMQLIQDHQPGLVFIEKGSCKESCCKLMEQVTSLDLETIIISNEKVFAFNAIHYQVSGFLLKPIQNESLVKAVQKVINNIRRRKEQLEKRLLFQQMLHQLPGKNLIGIPTMEGFEFIAIHDIIRCEGLQKCTRVITKDRTDIISSYNLGEFIKLLCTYRFFSPHRSHLINLDYIRKYYREGSIMMTNGSVVPVSKRRKTEFLSQMIHI